MSSFCSYKKAGLTSKSVISEFKEDYLISHKHGIEMQWVQDLLTRKSHNPSSNENKLIKFEKLVLDVRFNFYHKSNEMKFH